MRYFSAVAETLNYRAASVRLHVSAPALSKQVRDLESELGVQLLDRGTTYVRLTNAGRVFLAEARQIIAHADRARSLVREAAEGRRGRLVVGNLGPLTSGYMVDAVTAFCARYPHVEVELTDVDMPMQFGALQKRLIDVGFTAGRVLSGGALAGYRRLPVLTTPLCAVMPADHRLASERAVSFAQLGREKLLCLAGDGASASSHRSYLHELFAARGLSVARVSDVRGFDSLLAMIAGGQGVSILSGRDSSWRVKGIVVRPFNETGADTDIDLHAVWRDDATGVIAANFVTEFRRLTSGRTARGRRQG